VANSIVQHAHLIATGSSLSGTTFLVAEVVISVFVAWVCYARTTASKNLSGRNPWGIPPVAWSIIGFVFGLIGLVLALIASSTNRPRRGSRLPPYAGLPPAYPGYNAPPHGGTPVPSHPAGPAPPYPGLIPTVDSQGSPDRPPPGWYPDPAEEHHLRLWDGDDWVDYVSDDGVVSNEPLPPPPAEVPPPG